MKICNKCGIEKSDEEFSWRYRGIERLMSCKACHNEYARQWYRKNKPKQMVSVKRNNKKYIRRNKVAFYKWLSEQECAICGEDDMTVFEMHHRDPSKKEIGITVMLQRVFSIERLFKEIKKCDVLCANCHKRIHYEINEDGHRTKKPCR